MDFIDEYLDHEFASSVGRTPEYATFERKYKNYLKTHLPSGYSIHEFIKSHFEFSCVIKSDDNKFFYLSIPDVRYVVNGWKEKVLIRTMAHDKDWTGGQNYFIDITNLKESLQPLHAKGHISFRREYESEM